jgi:hypothetical protein
MNRTRAAVERMAAQAVPTLQQLHRADPDPEQELARILARPRHGTAPPIAVARRSWRPVLVVAAVLVVLGALVVLVPALHGGRAPTAVAPDVPATTPAPPPRGAPLSYDTTGVETDPAALLQQLADRAAAQPAPPRTGDISYVRIQGGGRSMGTTPSYYSYGNEVWTAPDGSWRRVGTPEGRPPDSPDLHGPEEGTPRSPLPTDPAELDHYLVSTDKGVFDGPTPQAANWFLDLTGWQQKEVLDPAERAAFLRVIASKEGMTVAGAVTDRVGRRGIGVTATYHRPAEMGGYPTFGPESQDVTLIFDPDTGALLHCEEAAPAGSADPAPGTPESYESWVESAWVAAMGDRP